MSSLKKRKIEKQSAILPSNNPTNSLAILEEFFAYVTLPQAQQKLWNWLEVTVTGSFNKELTRRERCNNLFFYHQLLNLLEAADAIYKREDQNRKHHLKK